MTSLGVDFPKQQKRVREVLEYYQYEHNSRPHAGILPLILSIKDTLDRAEKAAISGDMVLILQIYQELVGVE